jgi:hypothetical protein
MPTPEHTLTAEADAAINAVRNGIDTTLQTARSNCPPTFAASSRANVAGDGVIRRYSARGLNVEPTHLRLEPQHVEVVRE